MSATDTTDIVIIGGGMVGLTMALAAASSEQSVVVVDRAVPENMAADTLPCTPRVSALTAASIAWLESLGVWQRIDASAVCPFSSMRVWDGKGTGSIGFDAADIYEDSLGVIVENARVVQALEDAVSEAENIQLLRPQSLDYIRECVPGQGIDQGQGKYTVALESGQHIHSRLIIGADGGQSRVRELAGLRVREWPYPHKAIVTTVETEKNHESTAWQCFLPTGPLAFLPLPVTPSGQNLASIVWSCVPELCDELMALDDQAFMERLGLAFEHRLGSVLQVNRRFAFPLHQRHATAYVKAGIALVGDAAHTIHPLAGQGVNLGLQDTRSLSSVIHAAVRRKENYAHLQVLSRYQRQRKGDNLGMMAAMEGFARLFGSEDVGLTWLRNSGLKLFDSNGVLKKAIIRQAMGIKAA